RSTNWRRKPECRRRKLPRGWRLCCRTLSIRQLPEEAFRRLERPRVPSRSKVASPKTPCPNDSTSARRRLRVMIVEKEVSFGPCCFCGKDIGPTEIDPCRVTVETSSTKWQVWHCHARCFRERLAELPDQPGLLNPAHF